MARMTRPLGRPRMSPGWDWTYISGAKLREAREAEGLTQADVAWKSKLQRSAISEYECSHRAPPRSALSRLCRALHITPEDLKP